MPRRENCLASVPPDMQYGTTCPSGANSSTAARIRAEVGESSGGGEARDGVLLVDLGAVPGAPARGQLQPARTPLTGGDGIDLPPAAVVEGERARLAHALGAPLEESCMLIREEPGTVPGTVLLV